MQAMAATNATEVTQLLERAVTGQAPDPVGDTVLAQLHTLAEPHAVNMAERAHQLLPPERTAPARQHYMAQAKTYRNGLLSGFRPRPHPHP